MTRSRSKNGPYHGGSGCSGSSSESSSCNTNSCIGEFYINECLELTFMIGELNWQLIAVDCALHSYKWVTTGNCNRITSVEECNCAASKVGFSDTTASPYSWTINEPPYCFKNRDGLYYNTYTSSSYACNWATGTGSSRACLCRGK